jgi:hypothetical protein
MKRVATHAPLAVLLPPLHDADPLAPEALEDRRRSGLTDDTRRLQRASVRRPHPNRAETEPSPRHATLALDGEFVTVRERGRAVRPEG